jgi:hypothetical protein
MRTYVQALRFPLMLLTMAALAGCQTAPRVRTDFDRGANFAQLRTFGFPAQTGTDRGGYSTLVTSHFKNAITGEMNARGLTYADANPDVVVNFYSEARDKTRVYSTPFPQVGVYYGRPRYYGWYSAWPIWHDDVNVVQYKAGTFKIDVVDPKRQQTIWEASVEERLSEQSLDNPQPNIARLVTEMFRKFPRSAATP